MIAYFDTSALVKLLIPEEYSISVRHTWDTTALRFTNRLAYPEARAALSRALAAERLSGPQHEKAKAALLLLHTGLTVVDVDQDLAMQAGDLAEELSLRGYDAVHLACALRVNSEEMVMVTWDRALRRAATATGLSLLALERPQAQP